MLATLTIAGMSNIHQMNAVKSVLAVIINGVALAEFVALGAIAWAPGVIMVAGGIAGGYVGAATARQVDPRYVRNLIMVVGVGHDRVFLRPMKAMVLTRPGTSLVPVDREVPTALPGEVVVKVRACGVCRTDLHIAAGELPDAQLPIVPGHEIVGRIEQIGDGVTGFAVGDRIGVPWLGYSCDECRYLPRAARESVPRARFTGYQLDGGYAEYAVADARYAFKLPDAYGDAEAAPLLCAGLIGYRVVPDDRRSRPPRTLRIRRGRAHHRAGRRAGDPRGVCVHVAGRHGGPAVCDEPRRRVGRFVDRAPAAAARRRDHFRAGRRARARGAARASVPAG